MATIDEIKIVVKTEVDAAIAKMTQLNNINKENTNTGIGLAKSIAGFTTGYNLAVQGAQAVIRTTADLIKNSIELAAGVERIKMEFSVLTGSMDKSNSLFKDMNDLALQTPLELSDITAAGKQLLSVGIPVDQITTKLRMLGDVAMGNPEKLQRLTEAFGQLKSKGVASMEQLNRFIEAGVPIMAELQKQTGKTGDEIFNMVSQGKIGYPEVTKALESLTGEGGLMHDMMAKVAQTTEGKLSTAMDGWKMILKDIGSQFLPVVNAGLDKFNNEIVIAIQKANDYRDAWFGTGEGAGSQSRLNKDLDLANQRIKEINDRLAKGVPLEIETALKAALAEWDTQKTILEAQIAQAKKAQAAIAGQAAANAQAAEKANDKEAAAIERVSRAEFERGLALNAMGQAYQDNMPIVEDMTRAEFEQGLILNALGQTYMDAANIIEKVSSHMAESSKNASEYTLKLEAAQKKLSETISQNVVTAFDDMFAAMSKGEDPVKAFFKAIVQGAGKAVEALGETTMAMGVLELFNPLTAAHGAGQIALGLGEIAVGAGIAAWGGAMAQGGAGTVTKPTLFLAGENGPEDFSFIPQGKSGMAGRGNITIIQKIGGSVIAEKQVMALGTAGIAKAIRGY